MYRIRISKQGNFHLILGCFLAVLQFFWIDFQKSMNLSYSDRNDKTSADPIEIKDFCKASSIRIQTTRITLEVLTEPQEMFQDLHRNVRISACITLSFRKISIGRNANWWNLNGSLSDTWPKIL